MSEEGSEESVPRENEQELLTNILDDIKLSEKLFQEDRCAEAYYLLRNIEQFSRTLRSELQKQVNEVLEKSEDAVEIHRSGSRMEAMLSLFEDSNSWNVWNSGMGVNRDVVVSIHKAEDLGHYHFKVEGRVNSSMQNVMAALLENELYRYWMPLIASSKSVAAVSTYRRIVRAELDFALLKKQTAYNAHGDILNDGSALITVTPLSSEDEDKHRVKIQAAERLQGSGPLPNREDRLDITGGILLQEEEYDVPIETTAADNMQSGRKQSMNMSGAGFIDNKGRRKSLSSVGSVGQRSGRMTAAELAFAVRAKEVAEIVRDRLSILSRHSSARAKSSGGSSSLHQLKRYEKSIEDMYGISATTRQRAMKVAESARMGNSASSLHSQRNSTVMRTRKQKSVYVQCIFQVDPKLEFSPDWIFNMAMRSSVSMIIPMLEHQALLFDEGAIFHERIQQSQVLYDEISSRRQEVLQQLEQQHQQELDAANALMMAEGEEEEEEEKEQQQHEETTEKSSNGALFGLFPIVTAPPRQQQRSAAAALSSTTADDEDSKSTAAAMEQTRSLESTMRSKMRGSIVPGIPLSDDPNPHHFTIDL